jgi:hypothetical protein
LQQIQRPNDPWVDYFRALERQAQGDNAGALAAVERAEAAESGDDEALQWQFAWLKNTLLIDGSGIERAYLESKDPREAFRRLAPHLAGLEDWDGVLQLTELHAATGARRATTIYWAVKAHWNRGEYEEVLNRLSPWPYDRLSRLGGDQLTELCDMAVRSALRLGRIPEAESLALEASSEYGLELPQVAVALAKGDRSLLRELLQRRRIARALFLRQLYRDRDLAPLLTEELVADIRAQHGLAWPHDFGLRNISLVLFFPDAPSPESVADCIRRAGGLDDRLADPLAVDTLDGRASRLWKFGADALVLTVAEGPFCDCEQGQETIADNPALRTLVDQHGGWIAIDMLQGDQADRSSRLEPAAARLAAELAEGALGCYVAGSRGRVNRLTPIDDTTLAQIRSGEFFRPVAGRAPGAAVYLSSSPPPARGIAPWHERQLTLRELADRTRTPRPEGHAAIRVRLTRGHAAEELWLKVIRSKRTDADGEEFIAEMTADSRLWPYLRTGERLHVNLAEPLEIRGLADAPR